MSMRKCSTDFAIYSLRRAFGIRFLCSVLLVFLAFFLDTEDRGILLGLSEPETGDYIFYYLDEILRFGVNYKLFLVFMTIGFAITIPSDWKSGVVWKMLMDLGTHKYSRICVGVSALSGGLSVSMGYGLYLALLRLTYPVLPDNYNQLAEYDYFRIMPYCGGDSLSTLEVFPLILLLILFLSGFTWTAVVAGLSLCFNNSYLVLVFPYILSRGYVEFAKALGIPNEFRIDYWYSGRTQPFSIRISLLLLVVLSLIIYFMSEKTFHRVLKWRMKNG